MHRVCKCTSRFNRELPSHFYFDCGVNRSPRIKLFVKERIVCRSVSGPSTGCWRQREHRTHHLPSCIPALTATTIVPLYHYSLGRWRPDIPLVMTNTRWRTYVTTTLYLQYQKKLIRDQIRKSATSPVLGRFQCH